MFTCPALAWVGLVFAMWGFIWGIFFQEFLWLCAIGFVVGWLFSKDC